MRVELSNGRQFIIKIRYKTNERVTSEYNERNQKVTTEWQERETIVSITEYKHPEPTSGITVFGRAICGPEDKFSKKIGKGLAFFRALQEAEAYEMLTIDESRELAQFELNEVSFVCPKIQ